ncbi:hypothetical protein NQ317_013690 [Molorchus minor]|uniref:DEUBAD domain-containing protein n=1 Tax=Molorchus minor TaxID=1323400 RepID=A0ABQ9J058_9CUCU|nr:hypothetical protein NQ317_013690 [Molorchus minor]
MEIDVTPDGNSEKSGSNSSHGEEENAENSSTKETNVSELLLNDSSKEHENTSNSNKTIKHALRQQARRRRKTTFASGNPTVPRIIVKPLPPQAVEEPTATTVPTTRTPTMREVLASIPGFTMKPRKRTNKKLSTAAQLEQTKAGCIDLETPDSILVNTNLRHLLNKATFASLPVLYQNKLVQLLPTVDRHIVSNSLDPNATEINNSGLNNEFFARACLEWQDRLAEGEFTPENQQKLKLEADKERSKLDPWKLKHFEPIWGDRFGLDPSDTASVSTSSVSGTITNNNTRPPIKTTIKLRPSTTSLTKQSKAPAPPPVKRLRTVGAMTRSCTSMHSELIAPIENKIPIPDLLPIKQVKQVQREEVLPKIETNIKTEKETTAPSDNTTVELQEKCIVNISDTILENNEETIIICTTKAEKRKRSPSLELEETSNKRKTPSPMPKSPSPLPVVTVEPDDNQKDVSSMEDNIENVSEAPSEDDKVSEVVSENNIEQIEDEQDTMDYEKEKILDENSSSSSSVTTHNIEENSSNETIETVDSLQLHVDYKEDTNQTDETSSTTTTTDVKSEQEQEETLTSTPDILEITAMDTDPLQLNENDSSESNLEDKAYNALNEDVNDQDTNPQNEIQNSNDSTSDNHILPEPPVEEPNIADTFQILPNTLILQQEPIIMETKINCSETCETDSCIADSAEKLEASVEQCDLVMAQLSDANFEAVRSIPDEDDRFIDAENYVLESGQISISETEKIEKERSEVDIQATLFGGNASRDGEECCWGMVDSSTEKLLRVPPLHTLEPTVTTAATVNSKLDSIDHVQVIPMQEELEVRLEEGTFPVVLNDWPYDVKMDSDMVKLELEVTLTPEIVSSDSLITSTVNTSSNRSSLSVTPSSVGKTLTTVIPPTTIVCLPSAVPAASMMNSSGNEVSQCATIPRPGMVQSSSSLPYLALSTSQPMRAVPTHSKSKPKASQGSSGNRNRNGNKPPPGAVNLERSYQICQAVIQNSPNRDQLRCQLKPPPSLLAVAQANNTKKNEVRQTQYSSVTSSRGSKPFTPPLPATANYQMVQGGNGIKTLGQKARTMQYQHQRQPSPPVVVRHVFTSGQGIPVTMAV